METLYDVLGARPDDDAESLKSAYRRAAKAHHPDRHAGDPDAVAQFTRIVAAYDILSDAKRRAAYDRLLEGQRRPLRSKARRASHQFTLNAIAAVVGIVLAGAGHLLFARIYGTAGDAGGVTTGQRARMIVVEPAKRADTKGEAPSHGPARAPQITVMQRAAAAASAVDGKGAWEAVQSPSAPDAAPQTTGHSAPSIDPMGPKAAAGDAGKVQGAEPPERPRSAQQKTAAMSQDEICKRDAAQLAQLRISQAPDEVIRFERELGCEKLRPQVIRLRESVDPQ
jgi:DnaJ domain